MGAFAEARVGLRRAAGGKGAGVELALEARAGLGGAKAKLALVEAVVPEGPELIEVSGGVVSGPVPTANDCLLDEESPFTSLTDSRTYFMPADSKVKSIAQPSWESKTTDPVSFSNDQLHLSGPSPVDPVPSNSTGTATRASVGGTQRASTAVSGGADESTVQLRVAADGSVLPEASVARTEKLWAPSPRPE